MTELKEKILKSLLDESLKNNAEYSKVIELLDSDKDKIVSYIIRSIHFDITKLGLPVTDKNVLKLVYPKYCFTKAIEYASYIENYHESEINWEFINKR